MGTLKQGELSMCPHTKAMQTESEGTGITLPELARAPRERERIALFILLLTLNAGWTDMLAYFFLGHVFASFLTGTFLFIGLGVAQGNSGLLIRALAAVLVSFVGVILGSFCLQRAPRRQTEQTWRNTLVRTLLIEWLLFLAFAILWRVTSNLSQQAGEIDNYRGAFEMSGLWMKVLSRLQ